MNKRKRSVSSFKRNVTTTNKINMKQQAKQINRMIRALKKKHTNVKDISYALSQLVGKLDHISTLNKSSKLIDKRTNLIKIKNIVELKPTSARAFIKALQEFKRSESSTNRGLVRIAKRQRQMLLERTSNEDFVNSLTDKELYNFHRVFEDEEYERAMQGLDSETAYTLMLDTFQYQIDEKSFEKTLSTYANNTPDTEIRKSMQKIYEKYLMRK